ncbi:hypothetical protein ACFO4O_10150 [Glaciecola siphonariae]|uniref:Uncharacterized protein n=1 Tax=Glaciecola siphonariae TaxID=521012 RepID=A0ABV9LVH4_9ALTE
MQISNLGITQGPDQMSQVSLRKGYWFYFEHEGNDISMFGSVYSGKEKVFFNNKEVSAFRNLNNFKSQHSFEKNGHHYEVKTRMTSILKGEIEVSLYCDGELIESDTVAQISRKNWKSVLVSFVGLFVLFIMLGYIVAKVFA